jgi:hypothetical protein
VTGVALRNLGLALTLVATMVACSGGKPQPALPLHTLGIGCAANAECASGLCLSRPPSYAFCSAVCQTNADCGGAPPGETFACGILPDRSRACVYGCPRSGARFACVGETPTACELLDDPPCSSCGCPEGLSCLQKRGCQPPSGVGGPCDYDSQCTTNNCSTFAHVCRVPVGSACTIDSCDRCLSLSSGWSYCSRECRGMSECNGGYCYGIDAGDDFYTCQPPCSASCACEPGKSFCDCRTGCNRVETLHENGQACRYDEQCRSGDCHGATNCSASAICPPSSVCWAPCSSSSECGPDAVCVDVTCAPGETSSCGPKCLATCDAPFSCAYGLCHEVATVEGATISACDVKYPDGSSCAQNSSCRSGRCLSGSCVPANALAPNGGPCDLPSECMSGNCVNAQCRGTALIGGSCTDPLDCAVGTCCLGGQTAGSCRISC